MLRHVFVALMFMLILAPLPAKADMVLDWNEYALQTIRDTASTSPVWHPGLWPLPRRPFSIRSIPSTQRTNIL